METPTSTPLDDTIEALMRTHKIPGVAAGASAAGHAPSFYTYGWRNRDQTLPMTPDTLMGIASLTKSFTAAAVVQLADAGALGLDDPVVRYLPPFARLRLPAPEAVTLHHLLTHSAGLPGYGTAFNLATKWRSYTAGQQARFLQDHPDVGPPMDTAADLLAAMAASDAPAVGAPGAVFSYSNEGFALLGAVIREVSGSSYEDYVAQHILGPLQMGRSGFRVPQPADEPVTALYDGPDASGEVLAIPAWPQGPATLADGFLRSTPVDMMRYLQGVWSGRVVRPPRLAQMMTAHIPVPSDDGGVVRGYGYGWFLDTWRDEPRWFHTGSMSGVGSYMAILPARGVTVVVLANLSGSPAERIGHILLDAIADTTSGPS